LFTLGEVLAVMLADDGLPLGEATRFRRIVAGSESNVAAGFVRLGHRARLVTRVGRDALGDAVAASLRSWDIDALVQRSDRPTGTIVRGLGTDAGVQAVHLREGAAAVELSAADVDEAWGEAVDVVFVTGIAAVRSESARSAVERTVELARGSGALVVVDPNVRLSLGSHDQYREALSGLRGDTDIAIGDLAELALLAGTAPVDAVASLIDGGCRLVVTKRGADGAVATDGTDTVEVRSNATHVVDTVGAGDAFAAGLIAGVVEGQSIAGALELASVVAARVVATPGDVEGFPWRSQISIGEQR
jgi:2-dehydro-3-deoxygluconokinase